MANLSKIKLPDNTIVEVNDTKRVAKAGDTMTGDLRLSANNLYIGSASNSQCHQQYDSTNKCLKFIFD